MALSDDQRKLLKLLAKQDEAYEAIAAATGASIDDLKAKAAEAIEALEEEPRAADPVEAPDPRPRAVEAPRRRPPRREAKPRPRRSASLPGNRRLAELVGGAVVVLLLILFATGAIDIGGDSDSDGDSEQAALSEGIPTSASKQATQAVLRGVGDSGASGRALFGRSKQQVLLLLAAKGLDPTPPGSSYAISLARSPEERIPIAATRVGDSGTISGQFQLPPNVLGLLATGYDEMEIALVVNDELETALAQSQREKSAPVFDATAVLRGPVIGPVVDAAAEGDG